MPFLLAHFYKATPNSPCKFNIILRSLLRHIRTNMPLTFSLPFLTSKILICFTSCTHYAYILFLYLATLYIIASFHYKLWPAWQTCIYIQTLFLQLKNLFYIYIVTDTTPQGVISCTDIQEESGEAFVPAVPSIVSCNSESFTSIGHEQNEVKKFVLIHFISCLFIQ